MWFTLQIVAFRKCFIGSLTLAFTLSKVWWHINLFDLMWWVVVRMLLGFCQLFTFRWISGFNEISGDDQFVNGITLSCFCRNYNKLRNDRPCLLAINCSISPWLPYSHDEPLFIGMQLHVIGRGNIGAQILIYLLPSELPIINFSVV